MRRVTAFLILVLIKIVSHIFYRGFFHWLTPKPKNPWKNLRLLIFMNHTSLFEPLFLQAFPIHYLWQLSRYLNIPGADITLNRPFVGTFWKLMIPNITPITRKKDASWENYLNSIEPNDVVMIAPEGRMKRRSGLDKLGNPMTVRGGVADIIMGLQEGFMAICLSGGLHHIQAPGEHFPKIFKSIHMNIVYFEIAEYKSQFPQSPWERKRAIVQDLQRRLENDCPKI